MIEDLFTGQEITDHRATLTSDAETMSRFNTAVVERGVFKGASKFYISAAHTQNDVEQTLEAFRGAVNEIS